MSHLFAVAPSEGRVIDVLDRVLDRGVVIEAAVRKTPGAISLTDVPVNVVVIAYEVDDRPASDSEERARQRRVRIDNPLGTARR